MEEKVKNKGGQRVGEKLPHEILGVILLNLGGPDSIQAVRPFLYNLFSDRQIIQLGPSFMQKPLAWLISTTRAKKTEKAYKLIGGKSPILEITRAQAKDLEKALNQQSAVSSQQSIPSPTKEGNREGVSFKVYIGMRYWHPLIENIIPQISKDGIKKLIALSLYPQYSITTSGSSLMKLKQVLAEYPIEVFSPPSWFNHPMYIEALVDVIKKGIESFYTSSLIPHPSSSEDIHVLFSAHSLPEKIIENGDPYVEQTTGTIREITERIHLKWHLSYQSKSGPVKWLSPSTEEKLEELAGQGIKNILVVPVSFVSDHIETLYEIDILYRNYAEKFGINLKRTDSLNIHPAFIQALKDVVIKSAREAGWA
jgi:protoporphyrin/coproporphyrin ferrochelatase